MVIKYIVNMKKMIEKLRNIPACGEYSAMCL